MLHNELCHKNKLIARNEQKSNLPKKKNTIICIWSANNELEYSNTATASAITITKTMNLITNIF